MIKINKIPKVLSEQWYTKDDKEVYKTQNDLYSTYIVIKKTKEFGKFEIRFHDSKENDCEHLFTVKTDSEFTFNCQIGSLAGIENIAEHYPSGKELYQVMKFLFDKTIGKNLLLIDIDPDFINIFKDSGLTFHEEFLFTSSNGNERVFALMINPL